MYTNLAARDSLSDSRMPLGIGHGQMDPECATRRQSFRDPPNGWLITNFDQPGVVGRARVRAMRHVFSVKPNSSVQARSLGRAEGAALLARVPAVKRPPLRIRRVGPPSCSR